MTARRLIIRQIALEDANRLKALFELKINDLVLDRLGLHRLQISFWSRIILTPTLITRHASAKHDALQFQYTAQLPSRAIKALADAQPAVVRIHRNVEAVKVIAFRVVTAN